MGKSNGGFLFNRINMWSLTPVPAGGIWSKQKNQITNILCSHALWGTSLWSQTYIPTFSGSAHGQHRYTVATTTPELGDGILPGPSDELRHLQQPAPVPELMKKRQPNRWSTLLLVSFLFSNTVCTYNGNWPKAWQSLHCMCSVHTLLCGWKVHKDKKL